MKALLLTAGYGTRLLPLTQNKAKCLVPIAGKPLLEYWLEMLHQAGIEPLINTHYLAEQVEDYLRQSPYRNSAVTVHEPQLLGTAGTILKNADFFEGQPFLLIHADNLSRFSLDEFLSAHRNRPSDCKMTMMTFKTQTPKSCGILELDHRGVVQKMFEKVENPPGNLANGAVYILESEVLLFLKSLGKEIIDFSTEVLPHYMGQIFTFKNRGYHRDIGTLESYEIANRDFKKAP